MPLLRFRFFILYQAPHCGALAPGVFVHILCRLKHFVMTIKLTGQQSIIMKLQVNIIDCANIEVPGMSYKIQQILLAESIHPPAPLCRNSHQHSAFWKQSLEKGGQSFQWMPPFLKRLDFYLSQYRSNLRLCLTFPCFNSAGEWGLWKHCWKKKKMQATRISFFSNNVLYPLKYKFLTGCTPYNAASRHGF